ncbi:cilia- and flagella-associated protein 58 [Ptiloglossa arizonensis]|uniref:cilia- and flagella-associated protein 58 n=1 Tax=Ptiloglossa arizonensis TaxID=3350558 RepID=UPI003FA15CD9
MVAVCSDIKRVVPTDIRSGAQQEVKVDVGQSFILGLSLVRYRFRITVYENSKILGERSLSHAAIRLAVHGKVEKQKEGLEGRVAIYPKEVTDLRREIEKTKQEEKSLRLVIQWAKSDIGRHKRDIDNIMNERDILSTQLCKWDGELSLQIGSKSCTARSNGTSCNVIRDWKTSDR